MLATVMFFLALSLFCFAQSVAGQQSDTCKALYQEIENDLAAANYCAQDSDCDTQELGGRLIKFGCFHFVNKTTDKEAIYKKMQTYYMQCEKIINDCSPSPKPVCIKSKCVSTDSDDAIELVDRVEGEN
ncbi:MAG: hypothetical protein NT014_05860 [Candidatus Omnitrophica bacterium]|nr:hypothetical protein [Candidatus Omnitrophota bacterium]